jgi:hypothetical protein
MSFVVNGFLRVFAVKTPVGPKDSGTTVLLSRPLHHLYTRPMSYTLEDFVDALEHVRLPCPPVSVLRAWGVSSLERDCWEGGFLILLQDGTYAYVTDWRGDQETPVRGAQLQLWKEIDEPALNAEATEFSDQELEWDDDPPDLNRWIAAGMRDLFAG